MGWDCEEMGVSTDGRFFRREPGMMKGTGEGEWEGKRDLRRRGRRRTSKSRPVTYTWREDYGNVVSSTAERSHRLATTTERITILTIRKIRYLRRITAYDVPPSGGQSGEGALALRPHYSGGLQLQDQI